MLKFLLVYSRLIYILLLSFLVSGITYSQSLKHQQYWIDFNPVFTISNKLSLTTEVGYRTEPAINIKQTYFRSFVNFNLHENVKLSLGAAEFVTWSNHSFRNTELRLSQYLIVTWPRFRGFMLKHRFGMNQRWFTSPESHTKFIYRSRYRIGLYSPKFNILSSKTRFYSSASIEILRNHNDSELDQWFDHDWITVIFGTQVTKQVKVEGHLILINRNLPISHDFLREVSALRLRVFYSIR